MTRQQAIEAASRALADSAWRVNRGLDMTLDEATALAALALDAVLVVVVPRITQAEHDRLLEGLRRLRSEIRGGSLARVHGGYEEALDDVKAMLLGGAGSGQ